MHNTVITNKEQAREIARKIEELLNDSIYSDETIIGTDGILIDKTKPHSIEIRIWKGTQE